MLPSILPLLFVLPPLLQLLELCLPIMMLLLRLFPRFGWQFLRFCDNDQSENLRQMAVRSRIFLLLQPY